MRIWNTTLLTVLLIFMSNAHALTTRLINYVQLVKAVEGGDDVKAIIHFDRCQIDDESFARQFAQNLDGASTRFNFTEFSHYKLRINGQLKDNVDAARSFYEEESLGKFQLNYGRLRVFDDNTAELHVDFYDPVDKKRLALNWRCDISNGNDANGLVLFNSP